MRKIVAIIIEFNDTDFDLDKITKEYIEGVLRRAGIMNDYDSPRVEVCEPVAWDD